MTGGEAPRQGDGPGRELTLAEKIDRLFKTMHPRDRGEWTYREVSTALSEEGIKLSTSYLWQLRVGQKDNPTIRQIEALARFFHVPMTYFFGTREEVAKVDAQIAVVGALQRSGMSDVVMRASDLTPEALYALAEMADTLTRTPGMSTSRRKRLRAGPGGSGAEPPSGTEGESSAAEEAQGRTATQ